MAMDLHCRSMNIKKEVSVSKVAEIVIRELNLINIDVVEHA